MSLWFTSDTHFGHTAILTKESKGMGLRAVKWANVEEMDAALLDACNSVVQKNDTLYHLGDFGMENPAKYRQKILCRDIRFIWGNHDKHSAQKLFKFCWDVKTIKLEWGEETVPVWLSHYPHAYWPKSHYGSLHLYGHMHSQREADLDTAFPERRSMDVGVDNVMRLLGSPRPISEKEVLERLMARKGHDPIEFYR